MKKALIISNSSGLVTSFLKNDVEILKSREYLIECACNTKFPDNNTYSFFKKYNIRVLHINFPIRSLDVKDIISSYKELSKIIKHGNYSLIHCHSTIAAVIGRQCAKKYRKYGLKVIYTSHGFPFYEGNNDKRAKFFYYIEKYFSKYTDALLTICNEDYNNVKHMKCHNVYLMHGVGVDVGRFINIDVDRELYRKKLGFAKEDKVVLSVGELNTNKNHQVVIKALGEISDSNMVYAICGRELTEKGKMKELEKLAIEQNVRLVFLGFRKDIPEICHSVDIGALPSFKEGLGLSGIEMLAAGIPVAASNRQGIKDYIKDGVTGYLANPEDSHSFAEAIEKTFELREIENIKEKCISMTKNFDLEQAYDTILKVYDSIGI